MNKKQLSHLEKRLMEERARVMKELGYYDESFNATLQSSDGDLSSYSFHMADQGTDAMEREKQFLFASQEGRYLWHVNEALRRLYGSPEKFGHCHQCGQEINFERLDALPHARLCITCKEKEEDGKRRCPSGAGAGAADLLDRSGSRDPARPDHQDRGRGGPAQDAGHRGAGRLVPAPPGLQSGSGVRAAPGAVLPVDLPHRRDRGGGRASADVPHQSAR